MFEIVTVLDKPKTLRPVSNATVQVNLRHPVRIDIKLPVSRASLRLQIEIEGILSRLPLLFQPARQPSILILGLLKIQFLKESFRIQ